MRIYGTLYKITCLANKMVYIGQTIQNVEVRWKNHIKGGGNKPLYDDIQRYGVGNFKFEVLLTGIDCRHTLNQLEIDLITLNDSYKNGYNRHRGGQDRYRESELWQYASEIIRLFNEEHKSMNKIAKQFNTNRGMIMRILNAFGIHTKYWSRARKFEKEICKMFGKDGLTQKEIAEHFSANEASITKILRDNGIAPNKKGRNQRRLSKHTEEILRLYNEEFLSYEKIAKKFGTNRVTMRRFIKELNVKTRKYSPRRRVDENQIRINFDILQNE